MIINIVCYCLVVTLGAVLAQESELVRRYDGYSVLRLTPTSHQQLVFLKNLSDLSNNDEIKFWKYPSEINGSVDVMVSPNASVDFRAALVENHFDRVSTMIANVESLIDNENLPQPRRVGFKNFEFWSNYQKFSAISLFLNSIVSSNPSIASVESIGRSYEGRDIRLIKLGANRSNAPKPVIFIDSGFHAREWITPATTTFFIQQLVDGYRENNREIRNLLETFDWNIVPVANPDGYEYSHSTDRMWRKTRSRRSGSSCYGVDPNRNFGYKWNVVGASSNPCSETYAGPHPISEPEMRAIADYITRNKDRIKVYLTIHSYSQVWIYPWGWSHSLTKDDNDLRDKAQIAVNALSKLYGTRYTVGTSANVLYPAAGGSDDWAYGEAGVKYSYTVELRDTGTYGFMLPKNQIIPTANETAAAFRALAKAITPEFSRL